MNPFARHRTTAGRYLRSHWVWAISAAWLIVTVSATYFMLVYSNSPGRAGSPPQYWPKASRIWHSPGKPTLVMFVHPRCPCSRASLGELALLMARCHDRVNAHVCFIQPAETATEWTQTGLWREAGQIPGVETRRDKDGCETKLFNVETSGDTVVYSANGDLLFHGGITISRGHAGDNPGRTAIQDILYNDHGGFVQTPAFGCSLFEPSSNCPPRMTQ